MKYISITKAAEYLRCSRQYIHECLLNGKIEGTKVGYVWIIPEDVILKRQVRQMENLAEVMKGLVGDCDGELTEEDQ